MMMKLYRRIFGAGLTGESMNHRSLSFCWLGADLSGDFMIQRLVPSLAAFAAWRRPYQLLILLAAFGISASAQSWSTFLDNTRATDWTSAGFTVPNYTANCSTQPSL